MFPVKNSDGKQSVLRVGNRVSFKLNNCSMAGHVKSLSDYDFYSKPTWEKTPTAEVEYYNHSNETMDSVFLPVKDIIKDYSQEYINAYYVFRCYGGPEEGGWYYDAGQVIGCIPLKPDEEEETIQKFKTYLEESVGANKERRSGAYVIVVIESKPAKNFPEIRPTYQ